MSLLSNKVSPLVTTPNKKEEGSTENVLAPKAIAKEELSEVLLPASSSEIPSSDILSKESGAEEIAPEVLVEENNVVSQEDLSALKSDMVEPLSNQTSPTPLSPKEGTVYRRGGFPFYFWHTRHIILPSSHRFVKLQDLRLVYSKNVVQVQGGNKEFERLNKQLFDTIATATVDSSNIVFYSTLEEKTNPKHLINLKYVDSVQPNSIKPTAFSLKLAGTEYIFSTDSKAETDSWIKTLKERISLEFPDLSNNKIYKSVYDQLVSRKGIESIVIPQKEDVVSSEADEPSNVVQETVEELQLESKVTENSELLPSNEPNHSMTKSFSNEVLETLDSKLNSDSSKGPSPQEENDEALSQTKIDLKDLPLKESSGNEANNEAVLQSLVSNNLDNDVQSVIASPETNPILFGAVASFGSKETEEDKSNLASNPITVTEVLPITETASSSNVPLPLETIPLPEIAPVSEVLSELEVFSKSEASSILEAIPSDASPIVDTKELLCKEKEIILELSTNEDKKPLVVDSLIEDKSFSRQTNESLSHDLASPVLQSGSLKEKDSFESHTLGKEAVHLDSDTASPPLEEKLIRDPLEPASPSDTNELLMRINDTQSSEDGLSVSNSPLNLEEIFVRASDATLEVKLPNASILEIDGPSASSATSKLAGDLESSGIDSFKLETANISNNVDALVAGNKLVATEKLKNEDPQPSFNVETLILPSALSDTELNSTISSTQDTNAAANSVIPDIQELTPELVDSRPIEVVHDLKALTQVSAVDSAKKSNIEELSNISQTSIEPEALKMIQSIIPESNQSSTIEAAQPVIPEVAQPDILEVPESITPEVAEPVTPEIAEFTPGAIPKPLPHVENGKGSVGSSKSKKKKKKKGKN